MKNVEMTVEGSLVSRWRERHMAVRLEQTDNLRRLEVMMSQDVMVSLGEHRRW